MPIMSSDLFITAMTAATAVAWVTCVRPIVSRTFVAAATANKDLRTNDYRGEKPTTTPMPNVTPAAVMPPPTNASMHNAPPQQAQHQEPHRQAADVMPLIPAAFGEDAFWREDSPLLGGQYHVVV
jgi:hypothetical protein